MAGQLHVLELINNLGAGKLNCKADCNGKTVSQPYEWPENQSKCIKNNIVVFIIIIVCFKFQQWMLKYIRNNSQLYKQNHTTYKRQNSKNN